MVLDYVALGILIFVVVILFYGIIAVHDIPYEMAKERNHPHQDAIHVGGWISLFTLHAIWPFLWVWATLYRPDRGYGFNPKVDHAELQSLQATIVELQARIAKLEGRTGGEAA
ncbi:MAG: DUF3302 domain-containing protein [Pseudomonadota bacterium]|nr:DUF3302 domain-containing protein [Pseudomonadota bacterium]